MTLHEKDFLAWDWTWVAATFLMLLARLYIRIYLRCSFTFSSLFSFKLLKFLLPEIFVTFAWLCWLAFAIIKVKQLSMGGYNLKILSNFNTEESTLFNKISYAQLLLYFTCLYSVKLGMLCFYSEFITRMLYKTWITLRIIAVLVATSMLCGVLLLLLWCRPISSMWSGPRGQTRCNYQSILLFNLVYIPHITTDFIILLLPLVPLSYMRNNITVGQKVGTGLMFLLGIISLICSMISYFILFMPIGTLKGFDKLIVRQFLIDVELVSALSLAFFPTLRYVIVRGWQALGVLKPKQESSGSVDSQENLTYQAEKFGVSEYVRDVETQYQFSRP